MKHRKQTGNASAGAPSIDKAAGGAAKARTSTRTVRRKKPSAAEPTHALVERQRSAIVERSIGSSPRVAGRGAGDTRRSGTANPAASSPSRKPDSQNRESLIARSAYFRAEKRGFAPGGELRDWLEAELEIDALLRAGRWRSGAG